MNWRKQAEIRIAVAVSEWIQFISQELVKVKKDLVGTLIYIGLLISIATLVWYLISGSSTAISAALGMTVVIFVALALWYPYWRWLR